jgi:hypothetical protein
MCRLTVEIERSFRNCGSKGKEPFITACSSEMKALQSGVRGRTGGRTTTGRSAAGGAVRGLRGPQAQLAPRMYNTINTERCRSRTSGIRQEEVRSTTNSLLRAVLKKCSLCTTLKGGKIKFDHFYENPKFVEIR